MYVSLPDTETRAEIFRIHFKKMPTADDVTVEALVERTEMYSGAEVRGKGVGERNEQEENEQEDMM